MNYQTRTRCICCKKKDIKEIINLGNHSFADRFIPKNKLKLKDPKYPLILDICTNCKFIQSRVKTNPKNRYLAIDYSYTSSNSKYSQNHWIKFANDLEKKINLKKKKIIEIGSNDGFLSKILKDKGSNVLGVDASKFMVELSKKHISAIQCIFNYHNSKKIKKIFGKADIILANNVFNHADEPLDFLKGVYNILNEDGVFIFEQPNFTDGLLSLRFDQIYHEHVSYFTARNINSILKKSKFKILSLSKNEYHGGSIRTFAAKKKSNLKEGDISNFINFENKKNIYKLSFYKKFMENINYKKNKLKKQLSSLLKKGYTISGIGAAAKSNTFLTYYDLNNNIMNFITDASKFKKNKFTPITRIVIKDDKEIKKYKKIACIILTWNISKILISKLKKINKKIKIIYT